MKIQQTLKWRTDDARFLLREANQGIKEQKQLLVEAIDHLSLIRGNLSRFKSIRRKAKRRLLRIAREREARRRR